jgi:hypothetical protein
MDATGAPSPNARRALLIDTRRLHGVKQDHDSIFEHAVKSNHFSFV